METNAPASAPPGLLARLPAPILARPRYAALAAGIVSATGFAPLSLWPLTIAAYALLIVLVARASGWKSTFMIGWLFGVGQFTLGNNWIATAFTYQAAMPTWLGWLAVVALALYLAVYPAFAALGAWWIARRERNLANAPSLQLVFAFAALWIVTEWLRSWIFTGFVWNPLGVALVAPGLADASRLLGTYGLGGAVVLAGGTLALMVHLQWREMLPPAVITIGLIVVGLADGGLGAPPQLRAAVASGDTAVRVTVVQPNISQETKADPAFDASNWAKLADLSTPADSAPPRLLMWPEAAIPDFLEPGYPQRFYALSNLGGGDARRSRERLAALLGPDDLLVTGTADLEVRSDTDGTAQVVGARNSVTVITPQARIAGSYDKAHLVPYGEYLPMRPLLSAIGLSRLVPGDFDFWPGPGPRTIDLPGFSRMGVQICYEMIFSGRVVDRANRPDFIFNPSNDAWFGGWGPPQHFAQARLRAIEEGLPVVRATPTGISGIIDADGRVVESLAMGAAGRIDATIPPPGAPTFFARHGNIVPLAFALLLLLLAIVSRSSQHTKNP